MAPIVLREISNMVVVVIILLVFASSFHGSLAQDRLSDVDLKALLHDLRGHGFFTSATVLSYLARPYMIPKITLLIPTDSSIAQASTVAPKDYPTLIQFHILERDLNFQQLKLLPVGTWLPTALPGYGVQVTSNSASNFSLDNAQVVNPNLCPSLRSFQIACQGISAILNPASQLSPMPLNPPLLANAPSNAPSSPTPPILPPSPSPSPSPILSPLASSPPSPSPSPLSSPPSPSPSPLIMPLSPFSSPSPSPSSAPHSFQPSPSQLNPLHTPPPAGPPSISPSRPPHSSPSLPTSPGTSAAVPAPEPSPNAGSMGASGSMLGATIWAGLFVALLLAI